MCLQVTAEYILLGLLTVFILRINNFPLSHIGEPDLTEPAESQKTNSFLHRWSCVDSKLMYSDVSLGEWDSLNEIN